jgi:hypothetical protein
MNKQETKILVENWRKLLNDNLCNEEVLILNEINLKNTLLNLAITAAALVPNYAEAVPTSTIQDEISISVENRTNGKISAYNVLGDEDYMTIVARSQEEAEKIAAKYSENGEENSSILIYNQDDARNINVRELAILKIAIEHGGPLTKLSKKARHDNSNDLADKFNKEIARSISKMSDREVENMYDIADSAIGNKRMEKIKKFASKKMLSGESYEGVGVGKINPDDINTDDDVNFKTVQSGRLVHREYFKSEIAHKKAALVFFFILPDTLKSGSHHDRLRSIMFNKSNSNFDFNNLL